MTKPVWIIDDDGDMSPTNPVPDTDSDCYVVDYSCDGTVDQILDYMDEDGDGHIDLKNSLPDILASVANYFAKHGWVSGGEVAMRAQPDAAPKPITVKDAQPQWPLEQLEAWGYAPLQPLNPGQLVSLQTLQGDNGTEYWFTFPNFYVITRYNRSPLYAMAVDQLAKAIAAGVQADPAQ